MKKTVYVAIFLALMFLMAACGGSEATPAASNPSGQTAAAEVSEADAAAENNAPASPTFSGDSLQFFGLDSKEAFNLMGIGATTASSDYISNDENGMEIRLMNSAEDMNTFLVDQVTLHKEGVSFYGIQVGGTLKEADKILMDGGAIYSSGLDWTIEIEGTTYQVVLATTDDTTIESVQAMISAITMEDINAQQAAMGDNPYAFTPDMHEMEPVYWE